MKLFDSCFLASLPIVLYLNENLTAGTPSLGQVDGKANYHSMRKAYEHNLGVEGKHFTAYNMISGPFGNARGRDMFMVQSLDGKLQIFEQSATAFTRQLMDCLLPGPIVYLPRLDAFVSTNYATQAECYRYQVRTFCKCCSTVEKNIVARRRVCCVRYSSVMTTMFSAKFEYVHRL